MARDEQQHLTDTLHGVYDRWSTALPPDWITASPAGNLTGLIARDPYSPSGRRLTKRLRTTTVQQLVDAGFITVGDEGLVPEYDEGRREFRWEAGRVGRRLVFTEAGRDVLDVRAGVWEELDAREGEVPVSG
jgi:hypothetical protein